MSGEWIKVKKFHTTLRSSRVPDECQLDGLETYRDGDCPTPSRTPGRPPYGYFQHFTSVRGPRSGNVVWDSFLLPPPQNLPLPPHNLNYQGQYPAGPYSQGYGPPPPSDHQSTYSPTYGQNQGYFGHLPPASHPPYNPTYQQQPMSSAGQSYQTGQGAYPSPYNQTGNSYSPPLPSHPDTQSTQGLVQNPSFAGPSDPTHSNGGSLTRTATAPANLHCEHRDPGNVAAPAKTGIDTVVEDGTLFLSSTSAIRHSTLFGIS